MVALHFTPAKRRRSSLNATMSLLAGHRQAWCPAATHSFDFTDACILEAWSLLTPAATVALFTLVASSRFIPVPIVPEEFKQLFRQYLTIEEAEALEGEDGCGVDEREEMGECSGAVWRTVVFSSVGLAQTLVWLGISSYDFYSDGRGFFALANSATWFYTTLRPILKSGRKPPYDLLLVYALLLCGASVLLGGALLASESSRMAAFANLVSILLVLSILLSMPMNVPRAKIRDALVRCSAVCQTFTYRS